MHFYNLEASIEDGISTSTASMNALKVHLEASMWALSVTVMRINGFEAIQFDNRIAAAASFFY